MSCVGGKGSSRAGAGLCAARKLPAGQFRHPRSGRVLRKGKDETEPYLFDRGRPVARLHGGAGRRGGHARVRHLRRSRAYRRRGERCPEARSAHEPGASAAAESAVGAAAGPAGNARRLFQHSMDDQPQDLPLPPGGVGLRQLAADQVERSGGYAGLGPAAHAAAHAGSGLGGVRQREAAGRKLGRIALAQRLREHAGVPRFRPAGAH